MGGNRTRGVEVTADPTEYLAALRQWWPHAKKELGPLLIDESVGMAEALMMVTPPFKRGGGGGITPQAKKVAMKTITDETQRVFKPMWKMPLSTVAHSNDFELFMSLKRARHFKEYPEPIQKLLKSRNPEVAFERLKKMFRNNPPKGGIKRLTIDSLSKQLRHAERVKGRIKVKNFNRVFYVRDHNSIKASIKLAFSDIGKMKAQWAHAAKQASGRMPSTTPVWVSSQPRMGAMAINNTKDETNPTVTLVNRIGNKYGLAQKFNVTQLAFNIRAKKLQSKLAIWLKKQIHESNTKSFRT